MVPEGDKSEQGRPVDEQWASGVSEEEKARIRATMANVISRLPDPKRKPEPAPVNGGGPISGDLKFSVVKE